MYETIFGLLPFKYRFYVFLPELTFRQRIVFPHVSSKVQDIEGADGKNFFNMARMFIRKLKFKICYVLTSSLDTNLVYIGFLTKFSIQRLENICSNFF